MTGDTFPDGVDLAGGPHPDTAAELARKLDDWGATRMLVFTNQPTGKTTVDFESPLPGDAPQRASVAIRNGQIEESTIRLGVLDPDAFEGHPTHNPAQVRRMTRIVQGMDTPGGAVVVNYGDPLYRPRPHILLNWVPSTADSHEIVRKEPPDTMSVSTFMSFLADAAEAVRDEFEGEFQDNSGTETAFPSVHPAKVKPDLVRPPQETRGEIKLFYLTHAQQYARIWEELDRTRTVWQRSTRQERETMLKLSYVQAVLSIRIPWERAEETFAAIMEGESIMDAWEQTNHGLDNKRRWMMRALANGGLWTQTVELLDSGSVDLAHELLLSDALGIGDAKVPFTLANLGFVQKMCIDGNIATLFQADAAKRLSRGEYEEVCATARSFFPELSEMLRPAELQWVLFDYQRLLNDFENPFDLPAGESPVSAHEVWFRHMPVNVPYVQQQMDRITAEARRETEETEEQAPGQHVGS